MNSTSNETSNPTSHEDPWVESGALVYVAMTVAVCAAVIMCCTWFLTSNETSKALLDKYCRKTTKYSEINHDEEEEIELRPNRSPQDSDEESREESSKSPDKDVFTLEDLSEDEDEHGELPDEPVAAV